MNINLLKKRYNSRDTLLLPLFCLFLILPPLMGQNISAQRAITTGVVVTSDGEPVIGAVVKTVDSKTAAVTNPEGFFSISVPAGTKLIATYLGYKAISVEATKAPMRIVMTEDLTELQSVEVVGYGTQKKVTVTGAISSIGAAEITKTPVSSITNIMSGALTGISSVQYSGEPGADAASIFVRGKGTWQNTSPLVQVDGVERNINDVDPNDIETITVLKDASATAVFGVRGANGVILITTKRGKEGKTKITFNTSTSIMAPTKTIELANSYQYATFYNQMRLNDGVSPVFSDDVIQKFKDHSDPIRFPDVNWVDYTLKKSTIQTQNNINISGGTANVKYYVSATMFTQGGLFKQFDLPYDLTYQYNKFNYRSNLDIDVTKSTTISLNIGGKVDNANRPYTGQGSSGMFKNLYWATPFSSPGLVDGKMVVTATDYSDLQLPFVGNTGFAYYGAGFMKTSDNTLNVDLLLNQKLDFLTKGLTFKAKGSYNSTFNVYKNGQSSVATYTPFLQPDGSIKYKKSGENSQIAYTETSGKGRNWYVEAAVNYTKELGNHHLGALLLYNQSKTYYPSTYSDIPTGFVGLVGRATYDWKNRYMIEFNIGHNGSENYAKGKRYGWFPAGSIGWIATEENFLQSTKSVLDYLKFRVSIGLVGNDIVSGNRFYYAPDPYGVNNSGATNTGGFSYNFGINNPSNLLGAYEMSKNNPNITWEKALKQNYGADINFVSGRLKTSFDYFREKRQDIMLSDQTAPGIIGFSTPLANLGRVNSWGWELSLKWEDYLNNKKFGYRLGVNVSYNQNKIIEKKEAPQNYDWLYQKNHRIGANSLYQFWRFYDENASGLYKQTFGTDFPDHTIALRNGDAVYVDLNEDGKIDSQDASYGLGYTDDPEYILGITGGLTWKNFDFYMQWTGAAHVSRVISDVFRQPFVSGSSNTQGGLLVYHLNNTWTEENPSQSSKYPRATWDHGSNNYAGSTLYEQDASYLRLKTIQIAYNFNMPFMKKLKMSDFSLALSGYNLLTFTKYIWGDPESRASNAPTYPLTRNYTLSLKVGF